VVSIVGGQIGAPAAESDAQRATRDNHGKVPGGATCIKEVTDSAVCNTICGCRIELSR
jgi:hypothetical protein